MSKNPKIPNTMGIPDDQAKKVREALSKKSIRAGRIKPIINM